MGQAVFDSLFYFSPLGVVEAINRAHEITCDASDPFESYAFTDQPIFINYFYIVHGFLLSELCADSLSCLRNIFYKANRYRMDDLENIREFIKALFIAPIGQVVEIVVRFNANVFGNDKSY